MGGEVVVIRPQEMGQGRSCSCSAHTTQGQISVMEMLHKADTGDIILFNNPMTATYVIKYATDSQWDHVGMILKYSKNPLETIMIESAGCGVFICYAEQRLRQVLDDKEPSIIGWRSLSGPNDRTMWKKGVHKYAESLIDTPYEQNFSDFVKAWLGNDEFSKALLSYAGGTLGEGATKGEDLNSLFCSELCAAIYKYAGLLDKQEARDSNAYSPKDFSSQTNAYLKLASPWELLHEVQVLTKLDSPDAMNPQWVGGQGSSPTGTEGLTVGALVSKGDLKDRNKIGMQRMALTHSIQDAKAALEAAQAADDATATAAAQTSLQEAEAALAALPADDATKADPVALPPPPPAPPAEAPTPGPAAPIEVDRQKAGCCR